MKQVIAVDVDDVIADTTEALRHAVNKRTGATLRFEDYKVESDYWGYYERVWQQHGLDLTLTDMEAEMVADQGKVPLLPGAAFALGELSKKYKIVLVTSRNPSWEKATQAWLKTHFSEHTLELYFAKSHETQTGEKSKGEICLEVGASWLIDDNPHHCLSALESGVKAVLFGVHGWQHDAPANLLRCKDWPAVLEYFDGR